MFTDFLKEQKVYLLFNKVTGHLYKKAWKSAGDCRRAITVHRLIYLGAENYIVLEFSKDGIKEILMRDFYYHEV